MSKINQIQLAIKELDAGSYQKLMDAYMYKKYPYGDIKTLGVQAGTNKTTPGTPDSFMVDQDNKYIFFMYGSWQNGAYKKIKQDILSCVDKNKVNIDKSKIKKIICTHISTNIHPHQEEELRNLIPGIQIEIIGLDMISHDLLLRYRDLATEFLNIPMDTHQIFSIGRFIEEYDKNRMNASLNMPLQFRETEADAVYDSINVSWITLVTGEPGVGKTRLVLEVCRKFETEGWQVLCIKYNGAELYEDLQMHISDIGKYLLFIDDANQTTQLNFILDYITSLQESMALRIVMTVRDYAKQRVRDLVCKYTDSQEIQINTLSSDAVKEILKGNLRIKNEDCLERIAQIAKGNARLAILAGKIIIDQGYSSLTNAENIFAKYYGNIMNEAGLTTTDIGALFVISFFGPFRYKENQIAKELLLAMNISFESFLISCQELHNKELVDLYLSEAAQISDQSFGNYILEYVLIEKKMILISQLLTIAFPKYKNKVSYSLNTIQKLFYSEESEKYLKEQINTSWEKAEEDQEIYYLEYFYSSNEEKTLDKISKMIDASDCVEKDVKSNDIEKGKSFNNISNMEISILSNFKYSKYYEDALELLLSFYERRPDLVVDFYFAFSDRMSFDFKSHIYNYDLEFKLVEHLWKHSHGGEDANTTVLMIYVLSKMLECDFDKMGLEPDGRTYTFCQYRVLYTDGSKKMRHLIWEILSVLYANDDYRDIIENIIEGYYVNRLDDEEAKAFCKFDLQCIQELFFDNWEELSFRQCKILRELEFHAKRTGVENKDLFQRYTTNEDFMIYNTLSPKYELYKSYEENELDRKNHIIDMISKYELDNYKKLFYVCRYCEEKEDKNGWMLNSGLNIIFEATEEDSKKYYNLVELYLKAQAPFGQNPDRIIEILFKNFEFEEIKNLLEENEFSYKHKWMSTFWKLIPEDMLSADRAEEFLGFIKYEATLSDPEFPEVGCLLRYRIYDPNIVRKVSETILDNPPENKFCISRFFGHAFSDGIIEAILDLYASDEKLLEGLYILACEASGMAGISFDHTGKLLGELVNKNIDFWDEFTKMLPGKMKLLSNEHIAFNYIWSLDNYGELIHVAYKNMLGDCYDIMVKEEAKAIFENSNKTSEYIKQRKKDWIKEYIKKNIDNDNNLKNIFGIIVSFFKDDRKEFMLELLKYRKDIEIFKMFPIYENSISWSGSEVPLIEEKIDFLRDLMNSIDGIDFIEHRAYLKKNIIACENYKEDILLREYLEGYDIT